MFDSIELEHAETLCDAARRHDCGMTTKIAVSLPDHLVISARAAVAQGRAESVSAYVADALAHHTRREQLADILSDLDTELGEPSAGDLAWADRALGMNTG